MGDVGKLTREQLMAEATHCALCSFELEKDWQTKDFFLWPTLDHILERSEGGGNARDNLAVVHRVCNQIRGARTHLAQMIASAQALGLPDVPLDIDIPLYAAVLGTTASVDFTVEEKL